MNITNQKPFLKKTLITAAFAALGSMPTLVFAQTHTGHAAESDQVDKPMEHTPGMDHGSMHGSDMDHGSMNMPGMDHGAMGMNHADPKESSHNMEGMDHGAGQMDHGDMQMQGGSAPADARDPDAYSHGYVRNAGKFALPPSDALIMSDMHKFGAVQFNRLEYVKARGDEWLAYEGEAWYGTTYDRAVIKAEGEVDGGKLQDSETEFLWRHAVATFWDTELGVRFDYAHGAPNREWLAFGIKGLAPYWFEVDATAYVGPSGRTALVFEGEYDIRLTQTLYLQPSVEVSFYGKDDEKTEQGSGLSNARIGLRLKKEITRQFVPYIGVEWAGKFGKTADYARGAGESRRETRFVAGLSFRF